MKKRTAVLLIALAVVILAAGGIALWQRDNIDALVTSRRSSEELEVLIAQNEQAVGDIVAQLPVTIRPLTEDEMQQIRAGELTESDVVDRILDRSPAPAASGPTPEPGASAAPEPGAPEGSPPAVNESEERVAALIAQIYVLQQSMTARLDAIVAEALAEYEALPPAERTSAVKMDMATRCLSQAAVTESICDAEMESILGELTSLLTETGGDLKVVDSIRAAYKTEKTLKKAYFIKQYS